MIDKEGLRVVGSTKVSLSRSNCNVDECNMGNFLSDAYANSMIKEAEAGDWTYAPIVLTAVGGIRTTLGAGQITYADLVSTIPFENTVDSVELRGDLLLKVLEYSATKSWSEDSFSGAHLVQVSGKLNVIPNHLTESL